MGKIQPAKINPGDIGGRGRHPNDPTGQTYGDRHWPIAQPHETNKRKENAVKPDDVKYVLIDVTTTEGIRILTVGNLREIECLGKLEKATGKDVIAPPLEGRGFSQLGLEQLQYLYWNTTQITPPDDYANLIQCMVEVANQCPCNVIPLEDLEREVEKLFPVEGSTPQSSFAPEKPKKVRQPKEPGAASAIPTAPRGGTTARVWEICEEAYSKVPAGALNWTTLRKEIMTACDSENFNKSTSATQFSKWRKTKGL